MLRFLANLGIVQVTAMVAAMLALVALNRIYNYHIQRADKAQPAAVALAKSEEPTCCAAPAVSDVEKVLSAFNTGDCQSIRDNASEHFRAGTGNELWTRQCLALRHALGSLRIYRSYLADSDMTIGAVDTDEGSAEVIIRWIWAEAQNRLSTLMLKTRARVLVIPETAFDSFQRFPLFDSPMPRTPLARPDLAGPVKGR